MGDDEETAKTGDEKGTNDAANGSICSLLLVSDDSTIVGVPEKSQSFLFLHETSFVARKLLSVADFDYNQFD